ncbi:hypothetical protein C5E22_11740 [Pectobacterium parmentieri]|uniref:hypothetical protein n=1 Tax=Pectobacterium TaxID=122277 RepID=UPI000EB0E65F|nr:MULTISPECIES: hypothetical protein [Pectobacterium]AYH10180.1 hypothetical protein C5E24_11050 [Pectobacterium parmentieri]AYH19109.1 hypothetical protein C5E22_11740 [Pectobacterium parmentieri]AZS56605.1 hypothetical protein C5E18_10995 [Pectobacterium parmentieri]MBQ4779049.1 hypothetical protein [Pectobacterium versatile]MBQ4783449.1 hypothetical protein [Pectobacterium versatile]
MKAKYATLIRSLLKNYHEQVKAIQTESYSVHSDNLQIMELDLKLAKCLEGLTLMARFNNEYEDYCEIHKITMMAFGGDVPSAENISSIVSFTNFSLKSEEDTVKKFTAVQR